MEIIEYQLIRPDGTVLWSAFAPAGASIETGITDRIKGAVISRYRSSEMRGFWVNIARFPDGYPGREEPA